MNDFKTDKLDDAPGKPEQSPETPTAPDESTNDVPSSADCDDAPTEAVMTEHDAPEKTAIAEPNETESAEAEEPESTPPSDTEQTEPEEAQFDDTPVDDTPVDDAPVDESQPKAVATDLDDTLPEWSIPEAQLTQIIEGLIFAHGRVLKLSAIRRLLANVRSQEIKQVLDTLLHKWNDPSLGIHLVEVGTGYQFRSDPICAEYIRELFRTKPLRLSRPALETLAIVAYRQPVTRAEIEEIRGVDVGGVLKLLLDKRLARILGKREEAGRPLIYGTSKDFLETFGLRSLKDLPTLQEFQELSEEHQSKVEATYGRDVPEEDANPLYDVHFGGADISKTAVELEKVAEDLEDAVQTADATIKEILTRKPYDEEEDETAEAVADIEVIAGELPVSEPAQPSDDAPSPAVDPNPELEERSDRESD